MLVIALFQVKGLAKLRLGQLERRAKKEAEAGQSGCSQKAPAFAPVEDTLRRIVEEGNSALREGHPAGTAEYWESLAVGGLTVCSSRDAESTVDTASVLDEDAVLALQASLKVGGYMHAAGLDWAAHGIDIPSIAATMVKLKEAGWPPVFIFMYDQVWRLASLLFLIAEAVLGHEVLSQVATTLTTTRITTPKLDLKHGSNLIWTGGLGTLDDCLPTRIGHLSKQTTADGKQLRMATPRLQLLREQLRRWSPQMPLSLAPCQRGYPR